MSDKTEQPTPKRLRDARKKGQVSKSKETTSAILIICLYAVIWIGYPWYLKNFKELILLPTNYYGQRFQDALKPVLDGVLMKIIFLTLPALAVVIIFGLAAEFFQAGFLFSFEPMKPDLKKLNPAQNIKKIVSLKNVVELIKSIIKISFIGFVLYMIIKSAMDPLLKMPYLTTQHIPLLLGSIMKKLVIFSSIAFGVIAAFDFFYQKYEYIKGLKMTKDEVKKEYKEMEGDPLIKSKRKQLHREIIMNDTIQKVKKASVLITNPRHIAVALFYDEDETKLPVVIAKGENLLAKKMIEIAKEEGIPIMQNVPLAHDLYDNVDIDQYITSDLIEPVAEVLRWIQQLKKEPK